jgi:hypothetical protein
MMFRVRILTTHRVHEGTQPAVCLHRSNIAEGKIGLTMTCVTSSTIEIPVAKNETMLNRSDATIGTMIILAPSMINLVDSAPLTERTHT